MSPHHRPIAKTEGLSHCFGIPRHEIARYADVQYEPGEISGGAIIDNVTAFIPDAEEDTFRNKFAIIDNFLHRSAWRYHKTGARASNNVPDRQALYSGRS